MKDAATSRLSNAILLIICITTMHVPSLAQYTKLLDFAGTTNGSTPYGDLISDGTFLYGMTGYGGSTGTGTVFKIRPDGTGYAKLHDFAGTPDGRLPLGSLISDGTFLYGITQNGGTSDVGTIFKIRPDGTGYVKMHDFGTFANGYYPQGSPISDGTFLYGMTQEGGIGVGTIYKIRPDGTGFTKLMDFTGTANGRKATGSLISDGTFLYGMTSEGGANGLGTVYKIMPDGTAYSKLLDFTGATNGSTPLGSLFLNGAYLYGMTAGGGNSNRGVIFRIGPDGTGFAKLLDFAGATNGSTPYSNLFSDGTFLYGMTTLGGSNGFGTIFKIMPDGTGFAKLLDFTGALGAATGSAAVGSFILDGTFLYAMTSAGGTNNSGTVFKYALSATLPTITNFTPVSGPIATTVTITGTNFSATPADNTVMFNGTTAVVTASTTTSITTTVPLGATTGAITVAVAGNTATSATNFTVTTSATITITTQPTASSVCAGANTSFTTAATGTTNLAYQWQFSTTLAGTYNDISNAGGYSNVTTPMLSVNTTGNFGAGFYRCKVNGDLATTVLTNAAELTVNSIPSAPITTGVTTCAGNAATLSASGGAAGQYRWYNASTGGVAIAGETNSAFITPLITATTIYYVAINNGTCESSRTPVTASVSGPCNQPPVIATTLLQATVEGSVILKITDLLSDPDNNLDLATLKIVQSPASGASASIDSDLNLILNYLGISFAGNDEVTIEVCDMVGVCVQQKIFIEVIGDIVVYNAISPNRDSKNPFFFLQYIDLLPKTRKNKVTIYNRWGDEVFSINDYDNKTRVFVGLNNNGGQLPSGTYFFKIALPDAGKTLTGFIDLRY